MNWFMKEIWNNNTYYDFLPNTTYIYDPELNDFRCKDYSLSNSFSDHEGDHNRDYFIDFD